MQSNSTIDSNAIVHLVSSEGDIFDLPQNAIIGCNYIKTMFDNAHDDDDYDECVQQFMVPQVSSKTLLKIISFLKQSTIEPMTKIEKPITSLVMSDLVQSWYAEFVNIPQEELFDIILGANFMDIPDLMDLSCATVASQIRDKTTEELCTHFNVEYHNMTFDDAELREKYPWVQDAPPMPEPDTN